MFNKEFMFAKFEKEIAILTERNITMGIEEFLLESAKKEGIQKGRQEGREVGREEAILETALKMKNSGLEITLISNITGLSVSEVEKL